MGLRNVVSPLFVIVPVGWTASEPGGYDALLLTSANAPRQAGPQLAALATLPCYCVGEATAAAARAAGLAPRRVGPSDGGAVLAMMAADGVKSVLHLCGRDHMGPEHPRLGVDPRIVYAAEGVGRLPGKAKAALAEGAVALLHSPRAGRFFSNLVDEAGVDRAAVRLAAISDAAADAAGGGWKERAVAARPRDQALLELAAKLCNIDATRGTGLGR